MRDLVFHCLGDAQRGLVALHTPAGRTPDRDAVTYWEDWRPDAVGAANGRRFTRVVASMFLHVDQLCELYSQTVAAVVDAAAGAAPDQYVATQGHVLRDPRQKGSVKRAARWTGYWATRRRCRGTTRSTRAWRPDARRCPVATDSAWVWTPPDFPCSHSHLPAAGEVTAVISGRDERRQRRLL
ncbi:hypothetical protein [Streptomyces sp. WM6368]|uniref:hypothetical protein n=1 Tax=Streptomyces sp. WM6368 TaxID=1415554 RepID=UPI0006AE6EDA|nr:hypothetical protein [Streptomyces sp. WM6368]